MTTCDAAGLGQTLRVFLRVVQFDTDLAMCGFSGFLDDRRNSLPETVEAMTAIGAQRTAATLNAIAIGLATRVDIEALEPLVLDLYLYQTEGAEPVASLLIQYVEQTRSRLLDEWFALVK